MIIIRRLAAINAFCIVVTAVREISVVFLVAVWWVIPQVTVVPPVIRVLIAVLIANFV